MFILLTPGDILEETVGLPETTIRGGGNFTVKGNLDQGAILPDHGKFDPADLTVRFELGEVGGEMLTKIRMEKFGKILPNHFIPAIAKGTEPLLIHLQKNAVDVQRLVSQGGLHIKTAQSLAFLPEALFRRFKCGDPLFQL